MKSKALEILKKHNVPGASLVLVSKDSILWTLHYGFRDLKERKPVTPQTLFSIGSVSKTFVALTAMKAKEDGFLQLNQPLKKLDSSLDFENEWEADFPVRYIHLLEHTSGFDEAHFDLMARARANTPLNSVMVAGKNALKTRWRPGHYYAYNTLGAVVAAYIIEKQVGMPYEQYVRQNILRPLNITSAHYHIGPQLNENMSKSYLGNDNEVQSFPDLPQWPAGSLLMRAEDMAKVVQMFLKNGTYKGKQIIERSAIKSMERPESGLKSENGVHWTYSKGLQIKNENGHTFFGHDGRYVSYLSAFGYSKRLDVGYVILLNNGDAGKALNKLKEAILPPFKAENREVPADADSTLVNNFSLKKDIAGCYIPFTSNMHLIQFAMRLADMQFVVEEKGQFFQKSILGEKRRLIHLGDNRFMYPGEPSATSVFIDHNGQLKWLGETTYEKTSIWWGYTQFYLAGFCILMMLCTLLYYCFDVPWKLFKKNHSHLKYQWPMMIALLSFLAMVISILALYEPSRLYSAGAILFFALGLLYLGFSIYGLFRSFSLVVSKRRVNRWVKWHTFFASIPCALTAVYLWWWDIVGLTLWSY